MRELSEDEIMHVSGGAFNFVESVKSFYGFLLSPKNPLNGTSIGNVFAKAIASIVRPVLRSIGGWVNK